MKPSTSQSSPFSEDEEASPEDETVYLGEPTAAHREDRAKGPFSTHNPFIAPIVESRELFTVKDRNCLHMEISIGGSNLSYQTGDHIAVWPTNAGAEVDRFLEVFGIADKRHSVINVKGIDVTAKVSYPDSYHLRCCCSLLHGSLCSRVSPVRLDPRRLRSR